MGAIALDNAAHAHGGCALEQCARDNCVGARDGVATTGYGQNAVMHALYDFADACLDARLVA